jgi:hypothetical protein
VKHLVYRDHFPSTIFVKHLVYRDHFPLNHFLAYVLQRPKDTLIVH